MPVRHFVKMENRITAHGGGGEIQCCHITNSVFNPLPIISSLLLPAKQDKSGETVLPMDQEEEGNEKRGNAQGTHHHIKGDNNAVSIFIDTGSGDDFISE